MASTERHETTPPQTLHEKQRELETKAGEIIRSDQRADKRRDLLERIKSVFNRG